MSVLRLFDPNGSLIATRTGEYKDGKITVTVIKEVESSASAEKEEGKKKLALEMERLTGELDIVKEQLPTELFTRYESLMKELALVKKQWSESEPKDLYFINDEYAIVKVLNRPIANTKATFK